MWEFNFTIIIHSKLYLLVCYMPSVISLSVNCPWLWEGKNIISFLNLYNTLSTGEWKLCFIFYPFQNWPRIYCVTTFIYLFIFLHTVFPSHHFSPERPLVGASVLVPLMGAFLLLRDFKEFFILMGLEASPFDEKEDIPITSQPYLQYEITLGPLSRLFCLLPLQQLNE